MLDCGKSGSGNTHTAKKMRKAKRKKWCQENSSKQLLFHMLSFQWKFRFAVNETEKYLLLHVLCMCGKRERKRKSDGDSLMICKYKWSGMVCDSDVIYGRLLIAVYFQHSTYSSCDAR